MIYDQLISSKFSISWGTSTYFISEFIRQEQSRTSQAKCAGSAVSLHHEIDCDHFAPGFLNLSYPLSSAFFPDLATVLTSHRNIDLKELTLESELVREIQ